MTSGELAMSGGGNWLADWPLAGVDAGHSQENGDRGESHAAHSSIVRRDWPIETTTATPKDVTCWVVECCSADAPKKRRLLWSLNALARRRHAHALIVWFPRQLIILKHQKTAD